MSAALLLTAASSSTPLAQESGMPRSSRADTQPSTMVHFEGCLFTETALTSPTPVVVPMGSAQTWVLTHVKPISGDVKEDDASKTTYGVAQAEQEQLRLLNGKRVGVTGRITQGDARPMLNVVSLREITGGCPVLPHLG
ncbi:MAG: hypothetical protein U0Q55_21290 [Vicinamibacterales bacterium]